MAYRTIKPVLVDNAAAIAGDFTGTPFSVEGFDRAFIEILVAGTMTGTVSVEASNDYVPLPKYSLNPMESPSNWCAIPLGLVPLTGVDQNYFIDFTMTGIPWLRVVYTSTGGAGTLTSVYTAKEF